MTAASVTSASIVGAYRARTPGSAALAAQAGALFPSGVTHDSRYVLPYGLYVQRARGAYKWDVDGHRYIDFFGGHGAHLLGHAHPALTRAASAAMQSGTQLGASHAGEVAWAQAIQALVPSVERVRFTSSGTEATLMAIRLARAFTGRQAILRFRGHYHGWHDHAASGYTSHFDGAAPPGIIPGLAEQSLLADPGDIDGVRAILDATPDLAAVILEPTGSAFGQVPLRPAFLHALRDLLDRHGALLVFDEVVTGFRVSRGGAQVAFDVRPDLSCFAKIVAGGMPGGAVGGRQDVMDQLDFVRARGQGRDKIGHPGTFNANPVSAAAGAAMLDQVATTDANSRADALAAQLRDALNAVFAEEGVPWAAYGTSSGFHVFLSPGLAVRPDRFDPHALDWRQLRAHDPAVSAPLRLALQLHGVDTNARIGGFLSAAHTAADVADTADAFRAAIRLLRAEHPIPSHPR